jgi:hypothetical protein
MNKLKLEACVSCSLYRKKIRDLVTQLQSKHPEQFELISKDCLELCQDDCAFRLNGAKLIVPLHKLADFEARLTDELKKLTP